MYPESSAAIYARKRFPSSAQSYFAAWHARLSHRSASCITVRTQVGLLKDSCCFGNRCVRLPALVALVRRRDERGHQLAIADHVEGPRIA
jgi:hypothetical protein